MAALIWLAACSTREPSVEVCNGVDDDLDGLVDEQAVDGVLVWVDGDGDGYGRGSPSVRCDVGGGALRGGDCDDSLVDVWPGSPERCNGLDDDCDGVVSIFERDDDGDGWPACSDCDDTDPRVYPRAVERCNGRDDDCNGEVDDQAVDAVVNYPDVDGDGYGDEGRASRDCVVPDGRVTLGLDCDDSDITVYQGARERCDAVDHDCDGDPDAALTFPRDAATLQDAIDRVDAGDTICVQPGVHAFSKVTLSDVWLQGTADEAVLDGDVVLADGGGVLDVVVSGELALSGADGVVYGVTVRGGTVRVNNTQGRSSDVRDLSITERCGPADSWSKRPSIDLSGVTVYGLHMYDLDAGECGVKTGDVYDLRMVGVRGKPGYWLLEAAEVHGFFIQHVSVFNAGILGADVVRSGSVRDVRLKDSYLLYGTSVRDVVIDKVLAEGEGTLVSGFDVWDVHIRDVRWSAEYLQSALFQAKTLTNSSVYDVVLDARYTESVVASAAKIRHLDVRDVQVRGRMYGLLGSRIDPVVDVVGLVVAGVDVSEASAGIISAGPARISHATLTGIRGYGPLLGAKMVSWDHVDVSWCDVRSLSDVGTARFSNTWNNADAHWFDAAPLTSLDPEYIDRSGTDPKRWDLHLVGTSKLVDAGDPDAAPDDDGSTADIGAYGGPDGRKGW